MKWILVLISMGITLFFGISFFIESDGVKTVPEQQEKTSTPTVEESQPIRIVLVGDIMLDRGVKYMIEKEGREDFKFSFAKIADYFKKADLVFGNLEGVISDKGTKVGNIYSFRADPKAIEGLISTGFNVLSIANNHALDYGREALEDCLGKLDRAGINYVGAGLTEKEAFSPLIKEINGVKIAFLAYTDLGPDTWRATKDNSGVAWISQGDIEKIKQDIRSAKEKSNILIVSLHSGEEYQATPSQSQIDFSKMAIDAGADLLVGHHPHVVQPNERYQNGWIFYNLGNFIFDQGFSEETMKGQIVEVLIENSKVKKVILREIKMNNYFQPLLP